MVQDTTEVTLLSTGVPESEGPLCGHGAGGWRRPLCLHARETISARETGTVAVSAGPHKSSLRKYSVFLGRTEQATYSQNSRGLPELLGLHC